MQSNIIEKLFGSFSDLERAIESAKATLAQRSSVPTEILERLKSYDGILEKQRALATKLCESINEGNWDEVSRQVGLINGLSAMIRDDARSILGALSANPTADSDEEKLDFC